jgi:hypothetical protein
MSSPEFPSPKDVSSDPRLINEALSSHIEEGGQSFIDAATQSAEEAWAQCVADNVEEDFRSAILPARQTIWEAAVFAMEDHPALTTHWDLFDREYDIDLEVSWSKQEQREDSLLEVTTSLEVVNWEMTEQILLGLQSFGFNSRTHNWFRGTRLQALKERMKGVQPPTLLGVEPVTSKRNLEYPRDQVEHEVAKLIVQGATSIEGTVFMQNIGVDTEPVAAFDAQIFKWGSAPEDELIRRNKKARLMDKDEYDYQRVLHGQELDEDLKWLLGERYEKFQAINHNIRSSQPVVSESN